MLKKRFLISWLFSFIGMFGLSMIWHGVILNDFQFISYPKILFFELATIAYLTISFALTFVYTYLSMGIGFRLKGSAMGAAMGFFIYLIAFVLGLSFKGSGTQHVIVDFVWQMFEQGFGGVIISFVYKLAKRQD